MVMSKINDLKTRNLITLINEIIRDKLYIMTCKSIITFINFFESFIPAEVKILGTNSVDNKYMPEVFPRIKNISTSKNKLSEDSAFHIRTEEPDCDINTTYDVIDDNLSIISEKFPLFHIFLKYKEEKFDYNIKVESFIEDLLLLFDEGIDKFYRIPLINMDEPEYDSGLRKYFETLHREKSARFSYGDKASIYEEEQKWAEEQCDRLEKSLVEPLQNFLKKFDEYKVY